MLLFGLAIILLLLVPHLLTMHFAPDMRFPWLARTQPPYDDIDSNFVSVGGLKQPVLRNQYSYGAVEVHLLSDYDLNGVSKKQYPSSNSPTNHTSPYFYRHPVNTTLRDSYNDIFLNTFSPEFVSSNYESEFRQSFRLVMFVGSICVNESLPEGVAGASNPIRRNDAFNVTMISQTT